MRFLTLFRPTNKLPHLPYADNTPDVPCRVEGNANSLGNVLDMNGWNRECVGD